MVRPVLRVLDVVNYHDLSRRTCLDDFVGRFGSWRAMICWTTSGPTGLARRTLQAHVPSSLPMVKRHVWRMSCQSTPSSMLWRNRKKWEPWCGLPRQMPWMRSCVPWSTLKPVHMMCADISGFAEFTQSFTLQKVALCWILTLTLSQEGAGRSMPFSCPSWWPLGWCREPQHHHEHQDPHENNNHHHHRRHQIIIIIIIIITITDHHHHHHHWPHHRNDGIEWVGVMRVSIFLVTSQRRNWNLCAHSSV